MNFEQGIERQYGDGNDRESIDRAYDANRAVLTAAMAAGYTHVAIVDGQYRFFRSRMDMHRAIGNHTSHTRGPLNDRTINYFM